MKSIVLILFVLFSFDALAQVKPLKSFSFQSPVIHCDGSDQLMPLDGSNWKWPPAKPGAVPEFGNPFGPVGHTLHIRKVCITHWITGNQSMSYALIGHSGANGDHASPPVVGTGTMCSDYPQDAPIIFSPGEYLDVHARCYSGQHAVMMTIWYTD